VTARAVGSLAELIELAFPLLALGGRLIAWKGAGAGAEFGPAERALTALGGGDVVDRPVAVPGLGDRRLIVVTKGGPTSPRFPRDPAARRREPW
jgi:16S rRNA (guanine527-N7)-methyltransferase